MANHKYNTQLVVQNVEMILQLYQNIIREFPNIQNFDCPPPPWQHWLNSNLIPKFFHPVMLNFDVPCQVIGEENCLFRAVSWAI